MENPSKDRTRAFLTGAALQFHPYFRTSSSLSCGWVVKFSPTYQAVTLTKRGKKNSFASRFQPRTSISRRKRHFSRLFTTKCR